MSDYLDQIEARIERRPQHDYDTTPVRPPRPAYCCGVCPQTMTGWDCTCPGNTRCTKETK